MNILSGMYLGGKDLRYHLLKQSYFVSTTVGFGQAAKPTHLF
jgi:hypothetical protein